jgi:hypothetical protein
MFLGQRRKQLANIGNVVGDIVFSKDVALDDPGLLHLANICDSFGEYGISIIRPAVSSKKSNETLPIDISFGGFCS